MPTIMQATLLCLLVLCWSARGEPLRDAMERRSHLPYASGYSGYAGYSGYSGQAGYSGQVGYAGHGGYSGPGEPVAYAAVPLHAPMPVVQMLSAAPLSPTAAAGPIHAATKLSPIYAPYQRHYERPYERPYDPYKGYAYGYKEEYAPEDDFDAYGAPSNSMLYARPDAYGGYSYYRKPAQAAPPRKVQRKRKPVIVRIHKYRVVRD